MPIQLKKTALGVYKASQAYVKGVKGGLNEVKKDASRLLKSLPNNNSTYIGRFGVSPKTFSKRK